MVGKPLPHWYSENMCRDMNGDKKQIAQELDVSFRYLLVVMLLMTNILNFKKK